MKLGMMQPYYFPYLGYWQLMNMVDEYIIYDDVNYIKGGWINRNRIKQNNQPAYFNLGVRKASQNRKINEHEVNMPDANKEKLLRTFETNYRKAPYYEQTMALLRKTLDCDKTNLAEYLAYCNRAVAEHMGIKTKIYSATELQLGHETHAQDRVIEICKLRGMDGYVNAIGGKELYSVEDFAAQGIELQFLRMNDDIIYPQGKGDFIPSLSILDVLMYNSPDEVQELLNRYTLE